MQKFAILGFPDDLGVKNNNGRPGASKGPEAFRLAFQKLKGERTIQESIELDNDVSTDDSNIEQSHNNAANQLKQIHKDAITSIVIGGGHDYAFPHLKGIKEALPENYKLGCINIDPHFDLRPDQPKILSGSPFYMALENEVLKGENFIEFGIQRHCNQKSLWEYARNKNIVTIPMEELRFGKAVERFVQVYTKLESIADRIVISLDLDSVCSAYAPGVSAPATEGFTPSEILQIIAFIAKQEQVISLGIYELNPSLDIDNRTAKLAAVTAYHFMDERTRQF